MGSRRRWQVGWAARQAASPGYTSLPVTHRARARMDTSLSAYLFLLHLSCQLSFNGPNTDLSVYQWADKRGRQRGGGEEVTGWQGGLGTRQGKGKKKRHLNLPDTKKQASSYFQNKGGRQRERNRNKRQQIWDIFAHIIGGTSLKTLMTTINKNNPKWRKKRRVYQEEGGGWG